MPNENRLVMRMEAETNNEDENVTVALQNSENIEVTHINNDENEAVDTTTNEDLENVGNGTCVNKSKPKKEATEKHRVWQLPLNKVKSIMKLDPDCHIISKDALFLTTKATELFLQAIGQETVKYTQMGKRKTILKKDLDNAINNSSSLCFLDGTLEQLCS